MMNAGSVPYVSRLTWLVLPWTTTRRHPLHPGLLFANYNTLPITSKTIAKIPTSRSGWPSLWLQVPPWGEPVQRQIYQMKKAHCGLRNSLQGTTIWTKLPGNLVLIVQSSPHQIRQVAHTLRYHIMRLIKEDNIRQRKNILGPPHECC